MITWKSEGKKDRALQKKKEKKHLTKTHFYYLSNKIMNTLQTGCKKNFNL